jgi:predicted dehydrogenase
MRRIHHLIRSGSLGRLLSMRFVSLSGETTKAPPGSAKRRHDDDRFRPGDWGMIYDCGVHAFDLLRWCIGAPLRHVEAVGARLLGYEYPDSVTAMLRFENDVKAVYDYDKMPFMSPAPGMPGMLYIEATLSDGSLLYRLGEPDGQGGRRSVLSIADKTGVRAETFPIYEKMRETQYEQFCESIDAGKLAGWFAPAEDAVAASGIAWRVIEAALANEVRPQDPENG